VSRLGQLTVLAEAISVAALADVPPELAALHALGGRATSLRIAIVLYGDAPPRGKVIGVGRRLRGAETRGETRRRGDTWELLDRGRERLRVLDG
jgi:hypothetical protein